MNWQVNYALENINDCLKRLGFAKHVTGDAIKISIHDRPDTLAIISASEEITLEIVQHYHEQFPDLDFICGYRKACVWTGKAINYVSDAKIGWGSAGTLYSALADNNVNTAAHKDYFYAYRLITQMRVVRNIEREFDRVFIIDLANGRKLRVGMLLEYEPTADAVRSFWDKFGSVDVMWNINPNGEPTSSAFEVGRQLGCGVMKWPEFKESILRR
ncbi:hypothetical protein QE177_08940 [Arsenophonus sp. aPb]|uniref:hypothetical protein n=1 Tax=Arsenophonus sp. aPb TaxID=3041619 RepID=UPI002468326A|nr:hypothetical protein [Arsenophonus sp. aPb]WGL97347.1 hypothetical protein QE177_08940 [Arsenophonus sp. aPb]